MPIQAYIKEVLSHIRSKEARGFVKLELENHLQAAKADAIKKGKAEDEAEAIAIKQMGDSTLLGQKMNRLHKPKIDWFTVAGFAVLIGFSMLPLIYLQDSYQMDLVMRKTIFSIMGIVILLACMFFDYRKFLKFGYGFYGIGIIFLLVLNFSPFSLMINGRPFLHIATFTIEASSTLPIFLLAWAGILSKIRRDIWLKIGLEVPGTEKSVRVNLSHSWWKLVLLYVLSVLLLLPAANLFLVLLYTVLIVVMTWFSPLQKREKYLFTGMIGSLAVVSAVFTAMKKPYMLVRFKAFLNPDEYTHTYGYLGTKAKEYMGNAGWFGQALPKEGFKISEAHTDFIFVTTTYGFGWLLAGILVLLLVGLSVRMILNLKSFHDPYGKLLTVGAVTLYTLSFSWSILMSIGVLPFVGVSLPFFSYGLMPTVLHSFLIGIVLSVYRRKDLISLIN
ncbi:FtsW/RodA/SpoVE family cell cycle protein [Robertmurraya andreesenii]|uniref:Cell division protein FtsW (Lipid II flippase) n=1 Tax=Anoxybacillus andreesenii TaxID=1325932 RepID=A0ABT9V6W1_9BACL|nr:FtsW/RodA/SpoVE family cell cycle protein [Robertmurraya andreesenii]MDQ0156686.1 cell division protein FtsW (lipid II flippase) [Robertmurraya andreesenii]